MVTKKPVRRAKLQLPTKLKKKRDDALEKGNVRAAMKAQKQIQEQQTYDLPDKVLKSYNITINRMERSKGGKPIPPKTFEYEGGPKSMVQLRISGGKTVHSEFLWQGNLLEAKKYLLEFMRIIDKPNKYRTSHISPNGLLITFPPSNDRIFSNYPIPYILMGRAIPKMGLKDIALPNSNTRSEGEPKFKPEVKNFEPPAEAMLGKPSARREARANGKFVPLKTVCAELNVDPRQARIKLRKAVHDKKNYPDLAASHAHHARWEWEQGSKALEDVKRAVGGK